MAGPIRTPLAQEVCETPELLNVYTTNVPCDRVGEVEDVASAAYLWSPTVLYRWYRNLR